MLKVARVLTHLSDFFFLDGVVSLLWKSEAYCEKQHHGFIMWEDFSSMSVIKMSVFV